MAGGSKKSIAEVRVALGGVSEWFDEYIATEEANPGDVRSSQQIIIDILRKKKLFISNIY